MNSSSSSDSTALMCAHLHVRGDLTASRGAPFSGLRQSSGKERPNPAAGDGRSLQRRERTAADPPKCPQRAAPGVERRRGRPVLRRPPGHRQRTRQQAGRAKTPLPNRSRRTPRSRNSGRAAPTVSSSEAHFGLERPSGAPIVHRVPDRRAADHGNRDHDHHRAEHSDHRPNEVPRGDQPDDRDQEHAQRPTERQADTHESTSSGPRPPSTLTRSRATAVPSSTESTTSSISEPFSGDPARRAPDQTRDTARTARPGR